MIFPSLKDIITLVSGYPRSGTSTMMRMLYLGGLTPAAHEDTLQSNKDNDSRYFVPDGYFELKNMDKTLVDTDITWMRGRVLKIVSPYIQFLPANRPELKFKAIVMQRDISEIIASLMVMRTVYEEGPGESVKYTLDFLKHWNIPIHIVKYKDLIQYPKTIAIGVADFLEADMDIDKMATAINKDPRKAINKDIAEGKKARIVRMVDGKTVDIFVDKAPEEEDSKICGRE